MTDEQIIKALECCGEPKQMGCTHCSVSDECIQGELNIGALVLDLINRQQAEIEKLHDVINGLEKQSHKELLSFCELSEKYEKVQAEIERLKGSKSTGLEHIESTVSEFWDGLQKMSMFKGKEKPTLEELLEYIEQKDEEIRRLQKDKADIIDAVEYRINQAKELAYKEFAERLKKIAIEKGSVPIVFDDIDNLLAELTPTALTKVDHSSLCETETYEG